MDQQESLKLVAYFSASQMFDESKNIFDCFLTLLETTLVCELTTKNKISFNALKNLLNDTYNLSIPSITLRYLLKKLVSRKIINFNQKDKQITLCNDENAASFFNTLQESVATTNDFFIAFKDYLKTKNKIVKINDIKKQCCNWLYTHTLELTKLINTDNVNKSFLNDNKYNYSNDLVEFLLKLKHENSSLFSTFLSLYNGALQASLLNFAPQEISPISEKKISITHIILDSNFILRILNLQSEFESTIAKETLESLKNKGCKFYILNQTIEEITSSIKRFLQDSDNYVSYTTVLFKNSKIQLTGLWEAFRRGAVSRTEFLNLSHNSTLRDKLKKLLNAEIIDLFDSSNISKQSIDTLISFKERDGYLEKQAIHDLSLIEFCRSKRGKGITLSTAKWWVLTNDERLSYWNQKSTNEIQECLTEVQLSNLLWIQNERNGNNGLMETIISLSNNNTLSNASINNFIRKINDYIKTHEKDSKKLDTLSILFANGVFTNQDINSLNDCDGFSKLENLIEKKAVEITNAQQQQQKNFDNKVNENNILLKKNKYLTNKNQMLSTELSNEKDTRKTLEDSTAITNKNNTIANKNNELTYYKKLFNYISSHKKTIGRITLIELLSPIVLIGGLIFYNKDIIESFFNISFTTANISPILAVVVAVVTILYYFCITLLLGVPLSPKEFFEYVQLKIFKQKLSSFMYKEYIPKEYISKIFKQDSDLPSIIDELNKNITKLNKEITDLKNSLTK